MRQVTLNEQSIAKKVLDDWANAAMDLAIDTDEQTADDIHENPAYLCDFAGDKICDELAALGVKEGAVFEEWFLKVVKEIGKRHPRAARLMRR